MSDRSNAVALLELARRTLRQQLMDQITPQHKYTALMVANAMAIVARQMQLGFQNDDDEEAVRNLAREIRAGDIDPASTRYTEIYQLLCDQARQNVLISNPGYLDQ